MNATEYKHIAFGPVFLTKISEAFEEWRESMFKGGCQP